MNIDPQRLALLQQQAATDESSASRLPAPTDDELLPSYGRARRAYQLAGLRAVLAQFGSGAPQLPAPGEVGAIGSWHNDG